MNYMMNDGYDDGSLKLCGIQVTFGDFGITKRTIQAKYFISVMKLC